MNKAYPAIAAIEFSDIPTGIYATDAMLKRAPISALKCGGISPGRYLTLIGGSVASVEEAFAEGLARGEGRRFGQIFLPDVHPALHAGILGARTSPGPGAIAILETSDVCSILRATERALKSVEVDLVEIRLADSLLAGKGLAILGGELHDIQAAVDLARDELVARNVLLQHRILTSPHAASASAIDGGTRFGVAELLALDGEEVAE